MTKASVTICIALIALAIISPVKSAEGPKYTVLALEYFGSLDHPIFPVVISNSYGEAERYQNALIEKGTISKFSLVGLHVVSPPLLRRLIAAVEADKGGFQQKPQRSSPYNGVSMTIVTPQGRKIFFFHIEPSMTLLDQLENLCSDNKSLRSDLLHFRESISLWGDNPPPRPVPQDDP